MTKRSAIIAIRLTPQLKAKLIAMATAERRSLSSFLLLALERLGDESGKIKPKKTQRPNPMKVE